MCEVEGEEVSIDEGCLYNVDDEEEAHDDHEFVEDTVERSVLYIAPSPYAPSRQERAEHNVTHCPYRSWCPHCRAGKGKSTPHVKQKRQAKGDRLPMIGIDDAFMSNQGNSEQEYAEMKIMVVKDRASKYVFGVPVPQKSWMTPNGLFANWLTSSSSLGIQEHY